MKKLLLGGVPLLMLMAAAPLVVAATVVTLEKRLTSCPTTPARGVSAGERALGLDATEWGHASQIVDTGLRLGIPPLGIQLALGVARQESGFRLYANDGHGGDLEAEQLDVSRSLRLPHDAVGTDHGSLGLFQQQYPWWGSIQQLMNPVGSARRFYTALLQVPGWQQMPFTQAAATVQQPAAAYRDAYADDAVPAQAIYAKLTGAAGSDLYTTAQAAAGCATQAVASGQVTYPVPTTMTETDAHNWGDGGASWSSWHTGTDFSLACGTPVLSAHAGTVRIDTSQGWAGPQLVTITQGPRALTTWYAHMQKVLVAPGQTVQPGQQIGEVGAVGNATGCHLHFEVHLRNGPLYGRDNVDPTTWLAETVERRRPA